MRYRKNKKGCKGGLTTNMDVTAVLRRIPHGDDCPMDEETAAPHFAVVCSALSHRPCQVTGRRWKISARLLYFMCHAWSHVAKSSAASRLNS
ncbi:hypothetical protein T4B_11104 [Trichinella pseudospiralis]|uniref:Uncharacterized protein n=1 Tax=Trichinella pseudospiralis TaxID=6337 RepID=A0A0V1HTP4_TRIPS|nr:hypothetical protein T4A_5296 [Trichinella pseudospiralis]KRZ13527.1 hypothetical protein T4B_11104 [Trichinella pseudospiralis]KRZ35785.1 hypothetical protein T4C_7388 [Trichinella pseudospiralis]